MAESEYIKIRRDDLKEALLAAYESGWSGTPEVAESVVLTILAGMSKSIAPAMDESVIIQKLTGMIGNRWDEEFYGLVRDRPVHDKGIYCKPIPPSQYNYNQKLMYDEWDAQQ